MPVGDRSSRQANLLSQVWTWAAGDISDNAIFKGHFEAALRAIKARTIILPAELDRYFFPRWTPNMRPSTSRMGNAGWWGHMAPMNPADAPAIDGALFELLQTEHHGLRAKVANETLGRNGDQGPRYRK